MIRRISSDKMEYIVHYSVSMVGGFLGGYALLNHHDLFGNAQTSNLIHIAMSLVGHNASELLLRLLDVFLYVLGFALTVFLPKYTKWNLHFVSVILNLFTIVFLFFMPEGISDFVALAPICLSTAFQWNSYKGAGGFVSSSIFSTNNLRQFTTSFFEYLRDHDKKSLKKTKFFGMVLLSFHVGAVLSYMATLYFGVRGVILGTILVAISGVIVCIDNGWISGCISEKVFFEDIRKNNKNNKKKCKEIA